MADDRQWLCLACSQIMALNDDEPIYACPNCGDTGIPADYSVRPDFKITWHELRCLVMWAEFWASAKDDDGHKTMRKVVYGIADRLHSQHMDGPSLTFSQELADLRSEFGAVKQNVIKEDGIAPSEERNEAE